MPILVVIGIRDQAIGRARGAGLLCGSVGDRENQRAWEGVFEDLKHRGVREVGLLITDGHQAMLSALSAKFPGVARQRCVKHKMENVLGYLPKKHRDVVGEELKAIFYQEKREDAERVALAWCEKYRREYPSAVECLWRDYGETMTPA
jgi:putative transposase